MLARLQLTAQTWASSAMSPKKGTRREGGSRAMRPARPGYERAESAERMRRAYPDEHVERMG